MTDRIPGAPGKCKAVVTGEELQKLQSGEEFPITLRRDDQPIKEGTPYNKASVLPDDLAEELCAEVADPAPKDALWALHNQKADTGRRKTGSEINIDDAANAPLLGLRIFGAAGTDENGNEYTVGENGSITVNVAGKNLADVQKFSADSKISTPTSATVLSNSYGTTISATTGDSIVVTQSKAPSTVNGNYQNGFFCVGFYCPLKVGDVVTISFDFEVTANLTNRSVMLGFLNDVNLSQSLVTSTRHTFTTTITESKASSADNWNYLEVRVDGKSGVFSNFQIEYGSAYTGYAPYQPVQTLTVPTPGGLPGNDVDYDEIDFAKGLLIRRCLEQSETPLPEDVMEAFRTLRTYAAPICITNDESAYMEVCYGTDRTAVSLVQNSGNRGKFLAVDAYGSVSARRVAAYVTHTEKSDGWNCRIWSDGFAELYLADATNAGIYPGACDPLFVLPFPVSADAMVQATVGGKVFVTGYTLTDGTDLRLIIEGQNVDVPMHVSTIHLYVAGYII